jgi:hypothetical protein
MMAFLISTKIVFLETPEDFPTRAASSMQPLNGRLPQTGDCQQAADV